MNTISCKSGSNPKGTIRHDPFLQKIARNRKLLVLLGAVVTVILFLLLVWFQGATAHAQGLMPDEYEPGSPRLYKQYPIINYSLDFQDKDEGVIRKIFSWMNKGLLAPFFMLLNMLWSLSVMCSYGVGYLLKWVFSLGISHDMIDTTGDFITALLGINTAGGSLSGGLIGTFLSLSVLFLGGYILFVGAFKHQFTKAFDVFKTYVIFFVVTIMFAWQGSTYAKLCVDIADGISGQVMRVSADFIAAQKGENIPPGEQPEVLRDLLFDLQIKEPWKILTFGDTEVEQERIDALLSSNPFTQERAKAAKVEANDYENTQIGSGYILGRFADIVILLIINGVISFYVLMFCVAALLAKMTFILFMLVLPFFCLYGMLPGQQGKAMKVLGECVQSLMTTVYAGFVLSVTFLLCYLFEKLMEGLSIPFFLYGVFHIAVFRAGYRFLKKTKGMLYLDAVADRARRETRRVTGKLERIRRNGSTQGQSANGSIGGASESRQRATVSSGAASKREAAGQASKALMKR